MARLPYADHNSSAEIRALAAQIKAERGNHLYPTYRMLLNSPPVAAGWLRLFTAIRQQAELAGHYRELAILYVELLAEGHYNFQQHVRYALQAGVTQAQIDALANWEDSPLFSEAERALLAYSAAMTREIRVTDEVFDALRPHFTPREIVELTTTIGGYNLLTRFFQALKIDPYSDSQFREPEG